MPDLDDAVGDMTDDLLEEAGEEYTYTGAPGGAKTITMARSTPRPFVVETGSGNVVEVQVIDFKCRSSDLGADPQAGHRIKRGSVVFEVLPLGAEKCFYRQSPKMLRIHTKLVTGAS